MFASFIYPYLFAFSTSNGLDAFSLVIDIFFLIDIIVNLRTTYINKVTGDEIYSPAKIARQYMISPKFYLDIIACIPFPFFKVGTVGYEKVWELVIVLKIHKVVQIN